MLKRVNWNNRLCEYLVVTHNVEMTPKCRGISTDVSILYIEIAQCTPPISLIHSIINFHTMHSLSLFMGFGSCINHKNNDHTQLEKKSFKEFIGISYL